MTANTALVRYEVRITREFGGPTEVIACHRRNEAIDTAIRIAAEEPDALVDAIQIGTAGGDPAIASGQIWGRDYPLT